MFPLSASFRPHGIGRQNCWTLPGWRGKPCGNADDGEGTELHQEEENATRPSAKSCQRPIFAFPIDYRNHARKRPLYVCKYHPSYVQLGVYVCMHAYMAAVRHRIPALRI